MDPKSLLSLIAKALLIANLIALDVGLVWIVLKKPTLANNEVTNNQVTNYVDQCGTECQKYIDQKTRLPKSSPQPTPTPVVVYKITPKTKTRTVSYVTISGSGSTMNNDWSDFAGTEFYFNTADYPGIVEVRWEANVKLFNGNGQADFRLYDATHGIGLSGSGIQTQSQTSTLITSDNINFWSGKNLIKVQGKSLTADTAMFDSGRLRIVTEN